VLVTGASGMLGAGVARALAERGDEVTVLQRHSSGLGLAEVLADLADVAAVAAAVSGQEAVVHLAARVNVVGPWRDYARVNVEGTRTVVDACRRSGVARLVYVSSPAVAHAGRSVLGAGAEPADPRAARGPYARSKAIAERLALAADGNGLAVLAVRPHLVWGPGDNQIVARIVARAHRGRVPLIGPAAALVDTTYVSNAVDALVAALDRCDHVHGEPLVVSNGEPRPVGDLLGAICRAAGAPEPRRHVPAPVALAGGAMVDLGWGLAGRVRPQLLDRDPPVTRFLVEQLSTAHWFDQRRTRRLLQWQPRVGLDEGLAQLARYYRGVRSPA
jgi:nucleoside-diphosphate-sugar epimerase